MAVLYQQLAEGMADVALIQEPCILDVPNKKHNQLKGGQFLFVAADSNARSCIYARNHTNALPLSSSVLGMQQQ
jgi:hypothetical protein